MLKSILSTMRSSPLRLSISCMCIAPDLLAPAKGWLLSMPTTRRQEAVVAEAA